MLNLEKEWISYVRMNRFWEPADKVLVAVSGGVDSIVLTHLLVRLPDELRPDISIVHINHQLREESDKEEVYIRNLVEDLGLPLYIYHWDQGKKVENNIESSAREMRYSYFKQVMEEEGINTLLTAHHLGDQAETVLMKLIRGGILEDKTGIQLVSDFNSGKLIRPLIPFSKKDLYDYAETQRLTYFEDETNHTDMYFRNRIRRKVLPLLKEENPKVENHLKEFSNELSDLVKFSAPLIQKERDKYYENNTLYLEEFLTKEDYLQNLVLKEIFKELFTEDKSFNKNYTDIFTQWMRDSSPNSSLNLEGNLEAQKEYNKIRFIRKEQKDQEEYEEYELEMNTWLELPDGNSIGLFGKAQVDIKESDLVFYIADSDLNLPAKIRHRENGDRMTLKGSKGSKKIKDIFIDQKIPAYKRDEAWVLTDKNDTIIWLIGYKESLLFNNSITDKMTSVFILRKSGK